MASNSFHESLQEKVNVMHSVALEKPLAWCNKNKEFIYLKIMILFDPK